MLVSELSKAKGGKRILSCVISVENASSEVQQWNQSDSVSKEQLVVLFCKQRASAWLNANHGDMSECKGIAVTQS